jgi:putative transposase
MSRPLRLEFPGALWHITSRGNQRQAIYHHDRDRRVFLDFLGQTIADAGWLLYAFVLMTNHYHLLLETPQPTLSAGMRDLNGRYAQWFNATRDRVGHLFQARFKGILVERETHLLQLIRYIVLNPVRAGMVRSAEEYPWSSYRATAGLIPPPSWLDIEWTLHQFHPTDRVEATRRYRQFVAAGVDASSMWKSLRGGIFLGSEQFLQTMQAMIDRQARAEEHPLCQVELLPVSIDRIIESVGLVLAVDREALTRRCQRQARLAFVYIARHRAHATNKEIAQHMKLSDSQVSALVSEAARQLESDMNFAAVVKAVDGHLNKNRKPET